MIAALDVASFGALCVVAGLAYLALGGGFVAFLVLLLAISAVKVAIEASRA